MLLRMTADFKRPFKILGVQQVAIGGASLEALKHLWVDMLGLDIQAEHNIPKENVLEASGHFSDAKRDVQIDLMQPLDPNAKPRVDIPPLNHIGLWVDDIEAAHQWLTHQGMRFTPGGIREGGGGHKVCFIHPKADEHHPLCGQGVLIELIQA